MDKDKEAFLLIIIGAAVIVLLMIAVVVDLVILYRRGKIIAEKEHEIYQQQINDLIQRFEVDRVQSVIDAQIKERSNIGRDVHDRLGGVLFVLRLQLQQMRSKIVDLGIENDVQLDEFANLLDEGVLQVRNLSNSLKTNPNLQFSYAEAMNEMVEILQQTNSLNVHLNIQSEDPMDRKPFEVELYAITQDLIRNTIRNASARSIWIELNFKGDKCTFTYRDDGRGMRTEDNIGLDIAELNQRLVTFDTRVNIDQMEDTGFVFRIEFDS